jgi:hypothetical protein
MIQKIAPLGEVGTQRGEGMRLWLSSEGLAQPATRLREIVLLEISIIQDSLLPLGEGLG